MEEWVKHESEGYPNDVPVPGYRKLPVSYSGTFSGPFGSGINNAPIAPYIIQKYGGEHWVDYKMRQGIAAIDDLISSAKADGGGTLQINAANLILLLQGKIYEGYACNNVVGTISQASLAEIQHVVRTRILEFTLELEKKIPVAVDIKLGAPPAALNNTDVQAVTNITKQVIHGNVTAISSTGDDAQILVQVESGDGNAFRQALIDAGLPDDDAHQLMEIVETEEAESADQPWGSKAKEWLANNIGKAADGTWKVGLNVATKVLTEAALKYYGFK